MVATIAIIMSVTSGTLALSVFGYGLWLTGRRVEQYD